MDGFDWNVENVPGCLGGVLIDNDHGIEGGRDDNGFVDG